MKTSLFLFLFLTAVFSQSWAENCSEENYRKFMEEKAGEKQKKVKVPSLYEMNVATAYAFDVARATCEVTKIKKRINSDRWKSLCSPSFQTTRMRCFRDFMSKHRITTATEITLLSVVATGVGLADRSRAAPRNRDIQIYQAMDILLYIFERADPKELTVYKLKKVHGPKHMGVKKVLETERQIYGEAKKQVLELVAKKAEKLGKGRRAASEVEIKWIKTMRPFIEKRLKRLKTIDRAWE